MIELLKETMSFVGEALTSILGFVALVLGYVFDSLVIFYTEMPMLFGLGVGILLTWVLTRRDKHPALKVVSAPLKLLLDVLDLAWDQVADVAKDGLELCSACVKKPFGWTTAQGKKALDLITRGLSMLKVKLSRKKD